MQKLTTVIIIMPLPTCIHILLTRNYLQFVFYLYLTSFDWICFGLQLIHVSEKSLQMNALTGKKRLFVLFLHQVGVAAHANENSYIQCPWSGWFSPSGQQRWWTHRRTKNCQWLSCRDYFHLQWLPKLPFHHHRFLEKEFILECRAEHNVNLHVRCHCYQLSVILISTIQVHLHNHHTTGPSQLLWFFVCLGAQERVTQVSRFPMPGATRSTKGTPIHSVRRWLNSM